VEKIEQIFSSVQTQWVLAVGERYFNRFASMIPWDSSMGLMDDFDIGQIEFGGIKLDDGTK
jgi:hypothetical protein